MTAQIPDKIIYKGQEHWLHTNLMEIYFAEYPDKRPRGSMSTALRRGHVATFEIKKDGLLYLNDVKTGISGAPHWKSVINEIFPNHKVIKIDWTGTLVLPSGELVRYVHLGYASSFEYYTLLEIENGILINEKRLELEEYREYQKEANSGRSIWEWDRPRGKITLTIIEGEKEESIPHSITLGIITTISALIIWWFAKLIKRRKLLRNGLHIAAHTGSIETIQLLVSKGVNVNAQDKDGKTPLDIAKDEGHTTIVAYLESIGAKSVK